MTTAEKHKIDMLLGAALLNSDIQRRLVNDRDRNLLSEYQLADETQSWLSTIPANSLSELAAAVISYR